MARVSAVGSGAGGHVVFLPSESCFLLPNLPMGADPWSSPLIILQCCRQWRSFKEKFGGPAQWSKSNFPNSQPYCAIQYVKRLLPAVCMCVCLTDSQCADAALLVQGWRLQAWIDRVMRRVIAGMIAFAPGKRGCCWMNSDSKDIWMIIWVHGKYTAMMMMRMTTMTTMF